MKVRTSKFFLIILIPLVGVIFSGTLFWIQATEAELQTVSADDGISKSVIIDQVHNSIQGLYFQEAATSYLENADYTVDLFRTDDITVDFYTKLPSMGHDYIIIRSHAIDGRTEGDSPKLFTGEKYSTKKYPTEQLFGIIGQGKRSCRRGSSAE